MTNNKDFEIAKNKCEMCGEKAEVAMNDNNMKLRYACLNHILSLWIKIGRDRG